MADIRQRTKPRSSGESSKVDKPQPSQPLPEQIRRYDEESNRISLPDIARLFFLLLFSSFALSYFVTGDSVIWGFKPWFSRWPMLVSKLRGPILLTPSELSLYNGTSSTLPIYISINHTIYDVSASPHLYGPGGGYSFFAGRDATRAFITGCFKEDLTSDVSGVEEMYIPIEDDDDSEVERRMTRAEKKVRREREKREARKKVQEQVQHWVDFYAKSGKYFPVGRVVPEQEQEGEQGEKKELELCEAAKKQRPKRSKLREEKEKGASEGRDA